MGSHPVRLVEVLGALSVACDGGAGLAPETTVRTAVLAGELAARLGDSQLIADCTVGTLLRRLIGPHDRPGTDVDEAGGDGSPVNSSDVGARRAVNTGVVEVLAEPLPVSAAAAGIAARCFERWDGGGGPNGPAGDAIPFGARIVAVASAAELTRGRHGRGDAVDALVVGRGGRFDPAIVDTFVADAAQLFDFVDNARLAPWEHMLDLVPDHPRTAIPPSRCDQVALAFGRRSDMTSPWLHGHSEGVARLAGATADRLDLSAEQRRLVRRAALVHDIGRVSVPSGVWDLPRRFSPPERARARLHAWETARVLSATSLFGDEAGVAGSAHERLDGSGYHRQAGADHLDQPARILAAADVAVALASDRPHRPARSSSEVVGHLRSEASDGRLDHDVVLAMCDALGTGSEGQLPWPDGLSDREVDVIRLVAQGASNKEIAAVLGITPKTVAHHVAHVYGKTGCDSRVGLARFALERGLL